LLSHENWYRKNFFPSSLYLVKKKGDVFYAVSAALLLPRSQPAHDTPYDPLGSFTDSWATLSEVLRSISSPQTCFFPSSSIIMRVTPSTTTFGYDWRELLKYISCKRDYRNYHFFIMFLSFCYIKLTRCR